MAKQTRPKRTAPPPVATEPPPPQPVLPDEQTRQLLHDAVKLAKAAHASLQQALKTDLEAETRLPVFHRTTVDATARRLWIAAGAIQAIAGP